MPLLVDVSGLEWAKIGCSMLVQEKLWLRTVESGNGMGWGGGDAVGF